jgi:hypothetical protein
MLAFAACGSDDESSGDDAANAASTEEFCAELGVLAGDDGSNVTAGLQDLAASAPGDVADDMRDFAELFAEMSALSEDASESAQAELADKMGEYEELTGRLDAWSNENCPDLPANVFSQN